MCKSGLYDPDSGCRSQPEVTKGGWPKSCNIDSDCDGSRYNTPGVCTCNNKNLLGSGYC